MSADDGRYQSDFGEDIVVTPLILTSSPTTHHFQLVL